jgi:hypothetical protein
MTLVFFGLLILADFLAIVCQPYCPPLPRMMDARVFLFPAVLAYGALALPYAGALALAFFNGLLWDALTVQILTPGTFVMHTPVMEISMGWSIILCGGLAMLVHGLRPLFLRGRWDLHCLASGFCTVVILSGEYLLITFHRSGLFFPREVWARIFLPGFFSMLMAPFVYLFFSALAAAIGYPVRVEQKPARH